MMKVYFAGSISGGRDNKELSKAAIEFVSKHAQVLTEHVGDQKLTAQGENNSPGYIHDRDMAWLKEADAVVAEVTTPSLGVGYELGYAEVWKKPTLCLFSTDFAKHKLSNMIVGPCEDKNSTFVAGYYADLAELERLVDEFFASL